MKLRKIDESSINESISDQLKEYNDDITGQSGDLVVSGLGDSGKVNFTTFIQYMQYNIQGKMLVISDKKSDVELKIPINDISSVYNPDEDIFEIEFGQATLKFVY